MGELREPGDLEATELVQRLERAGAGRVACLEGYVAPSDGDDAIKLYDDLSLTRWSLVAPDDVLAMEELADDGLTALYLSQDAQVTIVESDTLPVSELLLAGPISELGDQRRRSAITVMAKPKITKRCCRTLPPWSCAASTIVVVTTTICTETWPCGGGPIVIEQFTGPTER
jgi:hypothetical protein